MACYLGVPPRSQPVLMSDPSTDKPTLIARFRELLVDRRAVLANEQAEARAGTRVDGDHRPENRGERAAVTTQGYLAHGIHARMRELDGMLEALDAVSARPVDRVRAGALVELEDEDGHTQRILVLPGAQGDRLDDIVVISPRAPLARALAGAAEGDVRTARRRNENIDVEVVSVE